MYIIKRVAKENWDSSFSKIMGLGFMIGEYLRGINNWDRLRRMGI